MRFLGIGDYCDLSSLYVRLLEEGHEVKVCISQRPLPGHTRRPCAHVHDWRDELSWLREAGDRGHRPFREHRGAARHAAGRTAPRWLSSHRRQRLRRPTGERPRLRSADACANSASRSCTVARIRTTTTTPSAFIDAHPGRYVAEVQRADSRASSAGLQDGAMCGRSSPDLPRTSLQLHSDGARRGRRDGRWRLFQRRRIPEDRHAWIGSISGSSPATSAN